MKLARFLAIALSLTISTFAHAKFGWEPTDLVVDFGVFLNDGESTVLLDGIETNGPFDVEVMWRFDPTACLLQIVPNPSAAIYQDLTDDIEFNGSPAHTFVSQASSLILLAKDRATCQIDLNKEEFITVSLPKTSHENAATPTLSKSPIGATIMVFRATSFFTPSQVTIRSGERIVWMYADGSKEPHTVTSGRCRGVDCSGGGNRFDSGKTLNKPGDRFEHTFTEPGTFHYHCQLHTASMQATVIVLP